MERLLLAMHWANARVSSLAMDMDWRTLWECTGRIELHLDAAICRARG